MSSLSWLICKCDHIQRTWYIIEFVQHHHKCPVCNFLLNLPLFSYNLFLSLCASEHTVSAEGFLRGRSCPVCSAVSATVTWRTPCSRTLLKRKGTADGYVFQSTFLDVIAHLQQQEAVFLYRSSFLITVCVIFPSLCPVDV